MTIEEEIESELAFLSAVASEPPRDKFPQPNYTSVEYANKVGCGEGAAYGRLYRAWKAGRIGSAMSAGNIRVFWLKGQASPQ